MKLFVWCDPYPVSYGSSMVFAVAETEEAAREEIAARSVSWSFGHIGPWPDENDPHAIQSLRKLELKEPTRVVDVPCAEWHYWSE